MPSRTEWRSARSTIGSLENWASGIVGGGLLPLAGRAQQALGARLEPGVARGESQRFARHARGLRAVARCEVDLAELHPERGVVRIDAQRALDRGGGLRVVAGGSLRAALLEQRLARGVRVALRARRR